MSKYRNQIQSLLNIDDLRIMLISGNATVSLRKGGVKCYRLCDGNVGSMNKDHLWWNALSAPNSIVAALSHSIVANFSFTDFLALYKDSSYTTHEEFGLTTNSRWSEVNDLIVMREVHLGLDVDFAKAFYRDHKSGEIHLNATTP